jgi:hypothetical protein
VTVTEVIGRADVKTTMIYSRSSPDTKREAAETLSRIYVPDKKPADGPEKSEVPANNPAIRAKVSVVIPSYASN